MFLLFSIVLVVRGGGVSQASELQKAAEPAEQEPKQPTPPPDQWADILGIPGENDPDGKGRAAKGKGKPETSDTESKSSRSATPENVCSPKQLRSSKSKATEQPTPEKKSPIKSPPKKRKQEEFKSPEPEVVKKGKKKADKTDKTEKKKRKKSEKD